MHYNIGAKDFRSRPCAFVRCAAAPRQVKFPKQGTVVAATRWQDGLGDKMKIVALVERGGRARSFHVDHVNSKTIRNILVKNVRRDSVLMTDEAKQYRVVGREFAGHKRVYHSIYEYVRGEAHTNTIEGYFSIFKRGMKGVYQHCSEGHLHRYLSEFDFRYNTRDLEDTERAAKALRGISGKRLTYGQPQKRAHI